MTLFVCHSSRDHAAVQSLVEHLRAASEDVWLDQSLIGGDAWWSMILDQIRSCTVFLVALSNHSLNSKPCQAERDYAQALGLPILPVLIGDVDSYRIDPIFNAQSVDYRHPDVRSGMALIGAVHQRAAERKELPDPLPEAPPVPYEYLQRHGIAIHSPQQLSATEQSAILANLRQALHSEGDQSVRDDIRRLLLALRRRTDVADATATEIDQLLAAYPGRRPTAPANQPKSCRSRRCLGRCDRHPRNRRLSRVWADFAGSAAKPQSGAASQNLVVKPPVAVAQLDGLLLSPDQINTVMGTTGIGILATYAVINDGSAVADVNCRAVHAVQDTSVYAGSAWSAVRRQVLREPPQGVLTFWADQGVASFPSAATAAACSLPSRNAGRTAPTADSRPQARTPRGGPRGRSRKPTAP